MRPRELTLEGFRSYRDRATFSFRDRHLIGVVGPIGAGKSSLLEAIAFALYGKTPTFERDTRSLIHQLCDAAHVELVFEVDGQVWRVQRGLRRKGQSGHKLERLDADAPDAQVIEAIQLDKPVRERVEQLLGMGFDAFRRSVLLAQNRFAEFLRASDGQRNDVLKGVFGYERFEVARQLAKDRARRAEADLVLLEVEGARVLRAREELLEATEAAAAAAAWHDRLEAAAPEIAAHGDAKAAAERSVKTAAERVQALGELVSTLPAGDDVVSLVGAAEEGTREFARLEAAEAETAAEAAEAEAALVAITDRLGDRSSFTGFAELVARLDHEVIAWERAEGDAARAAVGLDEATAAARAADGAAEEAAERVGADEATLAAATDGAARAEAALHEARHADMARELRRHLKTDEPCPVCEQLVSARPRAGAAPKVAAADRALTRARSAEAKARGAIDASRRVAATMSERAAGARGAAENAVGGLALATEHAKAADAKLAATRSELVDRLGEGDPRALLAAREAEVEAAEAHVKRAAARLTDTRGALDLARRLDRDVTRQVGILATQIAAAWGVLGEPRDVAPDPEGVRSSFVELGETLAARLEEAGADRARSESEARAAAASLATELERLGLDADADLGSERRAASGSKAAADERVRLLEAIVTDGADLVDRIAGITARRDLAERLASDLQPSLFLKYVLAEERAALAEIGSAHLEELTDGSFRFTDDDTFRILDLNAGGAARAAESLSGGETFLASLALALALAEMVTRGGGRLDSLFLDEGFGSLDPEHLERAMEGIGRLVAADADRLVVLVSHVEQMRTVVEDLIVLDKDERTGDSVVVSGSAFGT